MSDHDPNEPNSKSPTIEKYLAELPPEKRAELEQDITQATEQLKGKVDRPNQQTLNPDGQPTVESVGQDLQAQGVSEPTNVQQNPSAPVQMADTAKPIDDMAPTQASGYENAKDLGNARLDGAAERAESYAAGQKGNSATIDKYAQETPQGPQQDGQEKGKDKEPGPER